MRPESASASALLEQAHPLAEKIAWQVAEPPYPTLESARSARVMTMAWCWDGEMHVVVHDARDPTDAEWSRYVGELHQFTMRGDWKILVYSAGGTPAGHQRHALTKTLRGHPVALVTASPIMRAMGLVMRALDPNIRVIAPQDEDLAFAHLRLTAEQRIRAHMHHEHLSRQVAGRSTLDQSAMR